MSISRTLGGELVGAVFNIYLFGLFNTHAFQLVHHLDGLVPEVVEDGLEPRSQFADLIGELLEVDVGHRFSFGIRIDHPAGIGKPEQEAVEEDQDQGKESNTRGEKEEGEENR